MWVLLWKYCNSAWILKLKKLVVFLRPVSWRLDCQTRPLPPALSGGLISNLYLGTIRDAFVTGLVIWPFGFPFLLPSPSVRPSSHTAGFTTTDWIFYFHLTIQYWGCWPGQLTFENLSYIAQRKHFKAVIQRSLNGGTHASLRSSGTSTAHLKKEFLLTGLFWFTGRSLSNVTISLYVASQAAYSMT